MTEEENIPGCRITIAHDKENGEHYINIREADGTLIMKVHKLLWEDKIAGFTPEVRDAILTHARGLYG